MNFLKRIKKIIEINGNRLEPFHLNQIKKEIDDELGEEKENEENDIESKNGEKKGFENDLKLKPIYNNEAMKKKEITELKKQIKQTSSDYNAKIKNAKKVKKKDLKYLSIGRALSLIKRSKSGLKEEKNDNIEEIKTKIKEIEKMNMIDYLRYINGKERDGSIKSEGENDIDSRKNIKNNDISYKMNFDLKV